VGPREGQRGPAGDRVLRRDGHDSRTRGSGVSSAVENTIVPPLLSEIDGVEGLENVIVTGVSNRKDMIDPAILRPGRLNVKIKIERPDAEAARDIFPETAKDTGLRRSRRTPAGLGKPAAGVCVVLLSQERVGRDSDWDRYR
jgi:SpoVK/Ycf46/Vps4 family AAA+-type ATPase